MSQAYISRQPSSNIQSIRSRESAAQGDTCSRPQNISQRERWWSLAGGTVLSLMGASRGGLGGLLVAGVGGGLVYRGLTGHCHAYQYLGVNTAEHNAAMAVPAQTGLKVEKSVTINRSAEELFAFWRKLENLPQVMRHLKSVQALDDKRSHWIANGPLGAEVSWDAEIFNEVPNKLIAWRSLPGSQVETAGSVRFESQGPGRGVGVHVALKYNPPLGKVGAAIATLLGSGVEQEIAEDLHRLKARLEAGEVPTTLGQPRGRQ